MAQVKTITCDICKTVITKARVLIVVRVGALPRMACGRGLDLCDKCGRKLDEWLVQQGAAADPSALRDVDDDEPPAFQGVG